jgi:hypothetical protein
MKSAVMPAMRTKTFVLFIVSSSTPKKTLKRLFLIPLLEEKCPRHVEKLLVIAQDCALPEFRPESNVTRGVIMLRILGFVIVAATVTTGVASAQDVSSASQDSAAQDSNAVTTFAIKSGKLLLSSKANPKPAAMPDGAYTNQSGLIIVILGGRVTRIQESTDKIIEIASMRLNRQRLIALMPSTNALMAVNELMLPSGTFKSEDGRSSITVVFGRPTEFTLPGA